MLRRFLAPTLTIAMAGLGACAAHHARAPNPAPVAVEVPQPAPTPADGLWAMLDPGCAKPAAADIRAWPHCASPFWISGRKALLILNGAVAKGDVRDASYTADLSLTPGQPLIAQVGTAKDGYLYLALTDLTRDAQGRLVAASGVAVACGKPPEGGAAAVIKPADSGCGQAGIEVVRKAATASLHDGALLTQAAWIAPGAPRAAE